MSNKPACRRYHEELYHYNHNHDKKTGRFTSGKGAGVVLGGKFATLRKNREIGIELADGKKLYSDKSLKSDGTALDLDNKKKTENKKSDTKSTSDNNNQQQNNNGQKNNQQQNNQNNNGQKNNKQQNNQNNNGQQQNSPTGTALKKSGELAGQASSFLATMRRDTANESVRHLDVSRMTDKEMNDFINRKALEKRYKTALAEDADIGRSNIEKFLTYGGAILTMGATVASIAVAIHQLNS